MESIEKIFASNVRRFREERGWTQETLAERMGVAINTIQAYEGHRRWPKPEYIAPLARALGIHESRLLEDPAITPKPTLAEALAVVESELGIKITPVRAMSTDPIPEDIRAKLTPSLPSSAWDAIRAILAGINNHK